MVRQHIMMEKYGRGKLLTSWQPGSIKRQEGTRDKTFLSKAQPQ
jgi:hypothetical protein